MLAALAASAAVLAALRAARANSRFSERIFLELAWRRSLPLFAVTDDLLYSFWRASPLSVTILSSSPSPPLIFESIFSGPFFIFHPPPLWSECAVMMASGVLRDNCAPIDICSPIDLAPAAALIICCLMISVALLVWYVAIPCCSARFMTVRIGFVKISLELSHTHCTFSLSPPAGGLGSACAAPSGRIWSNL